MERVIKCVAVGALAWAVGPASAGSGNVEIRAQVPAACSVSVTSVVSQVRFNPLQLTANVQRNCNAVHSLTVSYLPTDLSNPSSLDMLFDGNLPTSSAPGTVTFANLPIANSTKVLTIEYSGPPPERTEIAATVQIAVTVP